MEAQKGFHGFDLDDHHIVDQQIEPIAAIKPQSFVFDGQRNLPTNAQSPQMKLLHKTGFISGLKQAWAQRSMNLQPGIDDHFGHRICFRRWLLASLACLAVHFTYASRIEDQEQDENITRVSST